jgi:para-nitrobenzyl esterase
MRFLAGCWIPYVTLLALVTLLVLAGTCPVLAETGSIAPEARTSYGVLEGLRSGSGTAFLGVPYAAPPVGDLRWQPPQPPRAWTGTRKAAQFSPACPQLSAGWLPYPVWSEDCLYLNVWTPKLSPRARLPVIVFFHGGSNRAGYSQLTPLGPALSRLGVVVVTPNYRLGPLGFFAHPALTAESSHHSSGNYGILDQIEALRWVRENIAHFGGDPNRITVMGQSAGAVDICLMMASPLARGLFQQAILESGDCESALIEDIRTPIPFNQIRGTGESNGERLAADLGITNGPGALRKLRSVPAKTILKTWSHDSAIRWDAIVDGWVIPEQPTRIFAEGRQAHIPVLVGSNADEATVFAPGPATTSDYRRYLRADTGASAEEEFRLWPASSNAEVPGQYLKLQNATFAYGAWSMARAMSRAGQPVYLYLLTWSDAGRRARLGACHGEELDFLSDSYPEDWVPVAGEKTFGEILRRYWTDFANSGQPGAPGLPPWPAYDSSSNQLLELGSDIQPGPAWTSLSALQKLMQPILGKEGP